MPTEPPRPTEWPGYNRTGGGGGMSQTAGLDLLENRQISAPAGSRPAALRHPVHILVTVPCVPDFLTQSGTAERLHMVAVPVDQLHTIPSSVGPPKTIHRAIYSWNGYKWL
jgi:hypothetical protein